MSRHGITRPSSIFRRILPGGSPAGSSAGSSGGGSPAGGGRLRALVAAMTAFAMVVALAVVGVFGGGVASADSSSATKDGLTASVTVNGHDYGGVQVLEPNDVLTMTIDYASDAPAGHSYTFKVSSIAEFDVDETALKNDNDVIESVDTTTPGEVKITFKDEWGSTHSGQFAMDFKIKTVSKSESAQLTWGIDGAETSIDVIVKSSGAEFAPTRDEYKKGVLPSTVELGDYFKLEDGTVHAIAGSGLSSKKITYTLTAQVTESGAIKIADTLDPRLTLDTTTGFTCSVVTWDTEGINKADPTLCTFTPTTSTGAGATGDSFTGTVTPSGPSIYTITYTATIDSSIKRDLQTFADTNGYLPANYTTPLKNKATFNGGNESPATVTATWNKPGVDMGTNSKISDIVELDCVKYDNNTVDASACAGKEIKYTLTYWSTFTTATDVKITDTLPKGMAYVTPLPSTATLTTWDTATYTENSSTTPNLGLWTSGTDGDSRATASTTLKNVPDGPAKFTVQYTAKIADTSAFTQALQDSFDTLGNGKGDFSTKLQNDATFNPKGEGPGSVHRSVTMQGTKTGLDTNNAFHKNVNWQKTLVTSDDGTLPENLPITYTLAADLSGTPADATHNVVITDTLPTGIEWGTIALDDSSSGTDITTLTALASACSVSAIESDTNVGKYCIDDKKLYINVGKDVATKAVIAAEATITSVPGTGAAVGNPGYPENTKKYTYKNVATFNYGASSSFTDDATSKVYVRPTPGDDGWNVPDVFSKSTPNSDEVKVDKGDSLDIPYTFTVGAGQGIDVAHSTITDYIDADVFVLPTDLSDVITTATYNGTDVKSKLTVTQDSNDKLLISVADPDSWSYSENKAFVVTITLTTKPFTSNESKTIINKADLTGATTEERYWSSTQSESTSYGSQSEVRKQIYDATSGEWTDSISSAIGDDGNLQDNPFVYRIDFIAHGTYGTTPATISAIKDSLPSGVTFQSFINESDVADPTNATTSTDPVDMGGNLQATYSNGTVTIAPKTGEKFKRGAGDGRVYTVYFTANVANSGQPIINAVEGSKATIDPIFGTASWQKTDGTGNLLDGSEWEVTGPAGADSRTLGVTDNGKNDRDSAEGHFAVSPLVPGSYTLTETKAPTGYVLDSTAHSFVVDSNNTNVDLGAISNQPVPPPPAAKTYAVGDYTWIDVDKDGIQDAGEPVLPGVSVELLNSDGDTVATTTTDSNGLYLFDNLDAGTYQIRFTLTDKQAATYAFTKANSGSDSADSDANQTTGLTSTFTLDDSNTALTQDYKAQPFEASEGIDPTWDAGVVTQSVSVGDYVWFDKDSDGRQDPGEPGIEGVTMCLVGPDGKNVIDTHGDPVKPTVTDRDGYYTFDDLPVLADGETYTVCIDKDASKHALENYQPTKKHVGDRAKDSSTWTASTQKGDLTKDGQRDATLDFGFVLIETEPGDGTVKTYAVGDYVWIDTTYNAVQESGEPGLPGVGVTLKDGHGKKLAATTTDSDGYYLFDGLSAGTYQICFALTAEQSAKYGFVMQDRGDNDRIDSDADVTTGCTAHIVLDDTNGELTTVYTIHAIAATQGIDPTWDAGVASLDVLAEQELGPLPGSDVGPTGDTRPEASMPNTGMPGYQLLTTALLLFAAGGALLLAERRRRLGSVR